MLYVDYTSIKKLKQKEKTLSFMTWMVTKCWSKKDNKRFLWGLLSKPILLKIILGCLKTSSGFPVIFYGKTQMKFLTTP